MKAVNAIMLGAAGLGCAALLGGCDEDSLFNKFKAHASVYYYNQITSDGAADQTALTNSFFVDADDGDSVSNQGYSQGDNASELDIGLDKDDEEDGVSIRGESKNGATLFSDRVQLTEDGSYLAVAYGDTTTGSVDVGVWTQDESDVPSGSARFRVIDTVNSNALNILSVDLRLANQDNAFAEDQDLGDATDYQTIDSGTLRIEVLNHGADPEEIIDTVNCTLSGGHSYDVILAVSDPLNLPDNVDDADGQLALYCHRQDVP